MKGAKGGQDIVQRNDDLCCRCTVEVPNVVVVRVDAERRSASLDEICGLTVSKFVFAVAVERDAPHWLLESSTGLDVNKSHSLTSDWSVGGATT